MTVTLYNKMAFSLKTFVNFVAKTGYQRAGVQYIIDSVIKELVKDPARRLNNVAFP